MHLDPWHEDFGGTGCDPDLPRLVYGAIASIIQGLARFLADAQRLRAFLSPQLLPPLKAESNNRSGGPLGAHLERGRRRTRQNSAWGGACRAALIRIPVFQKGAVCCHSLASSSNVHLY